MDAIEKWEKKKRRFSRKIRESGSFLLEKQWEAHKTVNERRRKSFYLLYSMCFFSIWIFLGEDETITFQIISLEVSRYIALLLAPVFVLLLSLSYLYLSCHSISSYTRWVYSFHRSYEKEIARVNLTIGHVHWYLKQRDFTSVINPFHILWQFSDGLSVYRKRALFKELSVASVRILVAILPLFVGGYVFYFTYAAADSRETKFFANTFLVIIIFLLAFFFVVVVEFGRQVRDAIGKLPRIIREDEVNQAALDN